MNNFIYSSLKSGYFYFFGSCINEKWPILKTTTKVFVNDEQFVITKRSTTNLVPKTDTYESLDIQDQCLIMDTTLLRIYLQELKETMDALCTNRTVTEAEQGVYCK